MSEIIKERTYFIGVADNWIMTETMVEETSPSTWLQRTAEDRCWELICDSYFIGFWRRWFAYLFLPTNFYKEALKTRGVKVMRMKAHFYYLESGELK